MSEKLQQAITAIRLGDKETGQRLLAEVIRNDPRSEAAWLWMSAVIDSDEHRRICLEQVLAINPQNETARRGLEALSQKNPPESLQAEKQPTASVLSNTQVTHSAASTSQPPQPAPVSKLSLKAVWVLAILGLLIIIVWGLAIYVGWRVLLSPIDIASSRATSSATLAPAREFTPTPGVNQEEQEYLSAVESIAGEYATTLGYMQTLSYQATDNPLLIEDESWRYDWAWNADNLLKTGRTVRRLNPPAQFDDVHSHLLTVAQHYDSAAGLMKQFLSTYDVTDLQKATAEILKGNEMLGQVAEELQESLPLVSIEKKPQIVATSDPIPTLTPTSAPTPTPTSVRITFEGGDVGKRWSGPDGAISLLGAWKTDLIDGEKPFLSPRGYTRFLVVELLLENTDSPYGGFRRDTFMLTVITDDGHLDDHAQQSPWVSLEATPIQEGEHIFLIFEIKPNARSFILSYHCACAVDTSTWTVDLANCDYCYPFRIRE